MLYERIQTEYNNICNQIRCIQNELQTLPPGKLICCHQTNTSKWYLSDGHRRTYIPKSNRPLAEQLAKKKYLSLLLEDLEKEKTALSFYMRHHSPTAKSEQLLTAPSEYQQLLVPYFTPLSQKLADWMNSTYEKNTNHPLGNFLIYPDFTIRHPHTGNFYYWEHFGMMDSPAYIEKTISKLNLYATHGITPGIQLITTYETKIHPLNPEIIEKYIEYHFT